MLGHVEGPLKRLVQAGARMPALQRQIVCPLELAQDLRFPEHHRIQPAGDAEKMMHALRLVQRIKLIARKIASLVKGEEELLQRGEGPVRIERRGRINLHAIARGQDNGLLGRARITQHLQRVRDFPLHESKPLSCGNRRGMVAQAKDDDGHGQA